MQDVHASAGEAGGSVTLLALSDAQMFYLVWFTPCVVMAVGCFALDMWKRWRR